MKKAILALAVSSLFSSFAFAEASLDPNDPKNQPMTMEEAREQGLEVTSEINIASVNGNQVSKKYNVARRTKRVQEAISLDKTLHDLHGNEYQAGQIVRADSTVFWRISGITGNDGKIEMNERFPNERVLNIDFVEFNEDGSEKSRRKVNPLQGNNGQNIVNEESEPGTPFMFELTVYNEDELIAPSNG